MVRHDDRIGIDVAPGFLRSAILERCSKGNDGGQQCTEHAGQEGLVDERCMR